jgi:hypothetical protein
MAFVLSIMGSGKGGQDREEEGTNLNAFGVACHSLFTSTLIFTHL